MTDDDTQRPVRPIAALIVLSLGLFMTLLDLTIVNVAIPRISEPGPSTVMASKDHRRVAACGTGDESGTQIAQLSDVVR
jgi:hypothetical protein